MIKFILTSGFISAVFVSSTLVSVTVKHLIPHKIPFETKEEKLQPPPLIEPLQLSKKAKILIIIDDVTYSFKKRILEFLRLSIPVVFSILPDGKNSQMACNLIRKYGGEIMLHLPMDYGKKKTPYRYMIFKESSEEEIKEVLKKALMTVPCAIGVNNHMGSIATEDIRLMEILISQIKELNLVFVDSLTSPKSVGYKLLKKFDLPYLKRDIFLDNKDDKEHIKERIRELCYIAKKKKFAIGIGHIHKKNLFAALKESIDFIKANGIEVVTLSDILLPKYK